MRASYSSHTENREQKQRDRDLSLLNMPFIRLEEEIQAEQLITVSRGLIVNLSFIKQIYRNGNCLLRDGTTIIISRRRRSYVLQRYHDYLFQRSEAGTLLCQ